MLHKAKKRFGQHFLTDESVINHIVKAIAVGAGEHVVEIGPGLGSITDGLVQQTYELSGRLDLIEYDRDLVPVLQQRYADQSHVHIHEQDALRMNFSSLKVGHGPLLRVVGNLPYNISSPLMFHLLAHKATIADMTFMMQEEVVDRMVAKPGTRAFGRLTLMTQVECSVEKLFVVPPNAFDPPPKVMSAVIRVVPDQSWNLADRSLFAALIEQAFIWRRKMMKHTFKKFVPEDQLGDFAEWDNLRPEQISLENFVKLTNMVYNKIT